MRAFRRVHAVPPPPTDPLRSLIDGDVDLARSARGLVVLLTPEPVPDVAPAWATAATCLKRIGVVGPDETQHSAPARREALDLDIALDALGPVDLIVDDSGAGLSRILRR